MLGFKRNSWRFCSGIYGWFDSDYARNPPYIKLNQETKEIKGIDIEIFSNIFNKLEVDYIIEEMPWARCELLLKKGSIDVGIKVSKTLEREKFLFYPKTESWESIFVLFTNTETKNKYKINSYNDIKKYNLIFGVIHENSLMKIFGKLFHGETKNINFITHRLSPQLI